MHLFHKRHPQMEEDVIDEQRLAGQQTPVLVASRRRPYLARAGRGLGGWGVTRREVRARIPDRRVAAHGRILSAASRTAFTMFW